jgi:hypothetical protein
MPSDFPSPLIMYKIIGADQKEYGPISADQIRQWIAEGRVNGQTQVCVEGTQEWKPLAMFPEFGLTAQPVPGAIPGAATAPPMSREQLLASDYSLDIMSCLSRAWALFKDNFGAVFVTFLLFAALVIGVSGALRLIFAAAGVNHLPLAKRLYFSPINIIFSSLVLGPAIGGVYHVYLSLLRGKFVSAGDLFTGFNKFQDLFLFKLITSVITTGALLPYLIAMAEKLDPLVERMQQNPSAVNMQEMMPALISGYVSPLPLLLIAMVPMTYLYVNWLFATLLIIDQKMGFWSAFVFSWKMVHKHWFQIFGLVVVMSLLNIVGTCMCCIGLLATMPLGMLAVCYAYEDIFGRKAA